MKLGPPRFWTDPHVRLPTRLLSPLSAVAIGLGNWQARRTPTVTVDVPVLCCGNLTMGGAGKTTLALDLGKRLIARGYRPHFLTRGYRGREKGPLRVQPSRHTAELVGDEPLLLARCAPTWVGRDRGQTARLAVEAGADCIVMDDGLQNHTLHQDFRVVTVDGRTGFGNGRVFPAGPLREEVSVGLERASAAVVIGRDLAGVSHKLPGSLPRFEASLIPGPEIRRLQGRRVVAFAGIAFPSKLFHTLAEAGVVPLRSIGFPDHHHYTQRDCARLAALRRQEGVTLVTTAKDAVRLPAWLREQVTVISIELLWADPAAPEWLLDTLLGLP